jgi:hypothetical protein
MYIIIGLLLLNWVVNFGLLFVLNEGGVTSKRSDGTYTLSNHGEVIRELTENEFYQHKAYEERLFSGALMVFYAIILTLPSVRALCISKEHAEQKNIL